MSVLNQNLVMIVFFYVYFQPKVVDVRPLEDMTQEKKLHKYLLIVDTSQRPG